MAVPRQGRWKFLEGGKEGRTCAGEAQLGPPRCAQVHLGNSTGSGPNCTGERASPAPGPNPKATGVPAPDASCPPPARSGNPCPAGCVSSSVRTPLHPHHCQDRSSRTHAQAPQPCTGPHALQGDQTPCLYVKGHTSHPGCTAPSPFVYDRVASTHTPAGHTPKGTSRPPAPEPVSLRRSRPRAPPPRTPHSWPHPSTYLDTLLLLPFKPIVALACGRQHSLCGQAHTIRSLLSPRLWPRANHTGVSQSWEGRSPASASMSDGVRSNPAPPLTWPGWVTLSQCITLSIPKTVSPGLKCK